jgi:hypothetical protein
MHTIRKAQQQALSENAKIGRAREIGLAKLDRAWPLALAVPVYPTIPKLLASGARRVSSPRAFGVRRTGQA